MYVFSIFRAFCDKKSGRPMQKNERPRQNLNAEVLFLAGACRLGRAALLFRASSLGTRLGAYLHLGAAFALRALCLFGAGFFLGAALLHARSLGLGRWCRGILGMDNATGKGNKHRCKGEFFHGDTVFY